ncbi:MAG: VOC family protein [Opitutales bacterium]
MSDLESSTSSNPDPYAGLAYDHIAIVTHDYERLIAWYEEILDFQVSEEWTAPQVVPGSRLAYLVHGSGVRLEIVSSPSVEARVTKSNSIVDDFQSAGMRHVCFYVDSVDASFKEAVSRGAGVLAPPFDFAPLQRRLALIQDPDGNTIEFVQRMPRLENAQSAANAVMDED